MNLKNPDLTYKQVFSTNLQCSSGHIAPMNFKIDGNEAPTRFFEIHKDTIYLGTFCEPCLIIANYIAKLQKKR
jgi:hypothetical protein